MKIIQKILVKQIITEESKEKLYNNFKKEKMQFELECQQLRFEQRKLENKFHSSKTDVTDRFNTEINKRREKITLIDFKIEQLDMLEIGSEIVEKEIEALVDVTIGAKWDDIVTEKAIIVQNNVVIRIDR